MATELRETRLPGVGVKHTCLTAHGARVTVILHNEGLREIYYFRHGDDEDLEAVIRLEDDEARQPRRCHRRRLRPSEDRRGPGDGLRRPRDRVDPGALTPARQSAARSPSARFFRARTGITIIAILREPEPVTGAQPTDVIQRGDTLVTVGKLGQYPAFRKLLAEGPFEGAPSPE